MNAKKTAGENVPHMYPCFCMNRGCCGGRDGRNDACISPPSGYCNSTIQTLSTRRKSRPNLAMRCENEPDLWASPRDPRYCIGNSGQGLAIPVKPVYSMGLASGSLNPEDKKNSIWCGTRDLDWRLYTYEPLSQPRSFSAPDQNIRRNTGETHGIQWLLLTHHFVMCSKFYTT